MLSEGIRAGCEFLGWQHRTIAHCEREIAAAAQLVAFMEAGIIDPAPIWNDLCTFDGRPWRGKLDCISAGFPCQPWSAAGKQGGVADERWIWPDIVRIIRESEPSLCFFENVRGLVSGGGLEFCLADLASLGFDAEWCVVSGDDVEASQERERVFILAYRNDIGNEWCGRAWNRRARFEDGSEQVADTEGERPGSLGERDWPAAPRSVAELCGTHLFAPGPVSDRWAGIIADYPHLAPATQPGVRMLAHGITYLVDESRSDQLRAIGNGVIPLAAATAFVLLARRAGIFE